MTETETCLSVPNSVVGMEGTRETKHCCILCLNIYLYIYICFLRLPLPSQDGCFHSDCKIVQLLWIMSWHSIVCMICILLCVYIIYKSINTLTGFWLPWCHLFLKGYWQIMHCDCRYTSLYIQIPFGHTVHCHPQSFSGLSFTHAHSVHNVYIGSDFMTVTCCDSSRLAEL